MSRTAAASGITVTRGATWEDQFTYLEDDEVTPIDLTGFEATLQVRPLTSEFGETTSTTLLLELTTDVDGGLTWDTAANGKLVITVAPEVHAVLNPTNQRKAIYAYALEVYRPAAGPDPRYVIPLVKGKLTVKGWAIR